MGQKHNHISKAELRYEFYILQNINNLVVSERNSVLSPICQIGNFFALRENIICILKSIFYGQDIAILLGTWWYRVSIGHLCLYILKKVEIWSGVTDVLLTQI